MAGSSPARRKQFDALQSVPRVLWEVKVYNFDDYTPRFQTFLIQQKAKELLAERDIASACGYDFAVGVRSAAHRDALLNASQGTLNVIVMDWCLK